MGGAVPPPPPPPTTTPPTSPTTPPPPPPTSKSTTTSVVSTPTPPAGGQCGGVAAWTSAVAYVGGQTAVYNGHLWTAKWWTQADIPGGPGKLFCAHVDGLVLTEAFFQLVSGLTMVPAEQ